MQYQCWIQSAYTLIYWFHAGHCTNNSVMVTKNVLLLWISRNKSQTNTIYILARCLLKYIFVFQCSSPFNLQCVLLNKHNASCCNNKAKTSAQPVKITEQFLQCIDKKETIRMYCHFACDYKQGSVNQTRLFFWYSTACHFWLPHQHDYWLIHPAGPPFNTLLAILSMNQNYMCNMAASHTVWFTLLFTESHFSK